VIDTQVEIGRGPLAVLLLITAGVMAPALWGEFVYDDISLVVQNPRVHSLTGALFEPLWGAESAYWRPLTGVLMAISLITGGAMALHSMALAAHLLAVCFAFGLARYLTKSVAAGLFTATFFALHPVQVESVAWGSAIQDPLVGMFVLWCLYATARWREAGSQGTPTMVILAFAFALASKETGIIALPAAFLLDRLLLQTTARASRQLLLMLGIILAIYILARVLVFEAASAGFDRSQPDPSYAGDRLITAPIEILGMFAQLLVLPWPLLPFRDIATETSASAFFAMAIWLLLPISILIWAWRRKHQIAVFGLGVALLAVLIPALRFHTLGSSPIADRYLYLATFGFALALTPLIPARATTTITLLLGLTFAGLDCVQIPVWRTQEQLIEHGLRLRPLSAKLLNMQGNNLLRRYQTHAKASDLQAAERSFLDSITNSRSASNEDRSTWRGSREESDLGLAWCELLKPQVGSKPDSSRAIAKFQACTTAVGAPADAWVGLGIAYGSSGQLGMAEKALTKAIAMAPTNDRAQYNLGFLYAQTQRPDQAIAHLKAALRLQPQNQAAADLLKQLR